MAFMEHPSSEVRKAIIQLTNALCSWERATGVESVFILREVGGFEYRAVNGKPDVPNDVGDAQLMKLIKK